MPELPDVSVYVECLARRVVGTPLERVELFSPFVLRSVAPPIEALLGKHASGVHRLGKRIVLAFEDELRLVIHLMIAGRLRWRARDGHAPRAAPLARLHWRNGVLWLTEASTKKRASLHVVRGDEALAPFRRGGVDLLTITPSVFLAAMRCHNRTLKRALTDPTIVDGIGNAYSDEILFRARLSPMRLTSQLRDDELLTLFDAARATLSEWTTRLRAAAGDGFPEEVTAFHEGFAVHGRFEQACRVCGKPVQRIRYADHECNYCAVCQNEGRLLADRGLSQLLKKDWPKTLDELEERRERARG